MRGHPIWELLLFGLLWGVLLVPLRMVTGHVQTEVPSASSVESQSVTAWLRLQFSEAPRQFTIFAADGSLLWSESEPALDMEQPVSLAWQGEAVVLRYEVLWPQAGRRAMEVQLAMPVGGTWRRTIWLAEAKAAGRVDLP